MHTHTPNFIGIYIPMQNLHSLPSYNHHVNAIVSLASCCGETLLRSEFCRIVKERRLDGQSRHLLAWWNHFRKKLEWNERADVCRQHRNYVGYIRRVRGNDRAGLHRGMAGVSTLTLGATGGSQGWRPARNFFATVRQAPVAPEGIRGHTRMYCAVPLFGWRSTFL